jgi:hypothetical protein
MANMSVLYFLPVATFTIALLVGASDLRATLVEIKDHRRSRRQGRS